MLLCAPNNEAGFPRRLRRAVRPDAVAAAAAAAAAAGSANKPLVDDSLAATRWC